MKYWECIDIPGESNEEELEIALNELENDNIIHQGKKGKYGLLSSYHWYIGEIRLKKQGYGFFKCDELEEDVTKYIRKKKEVKSLA